MTPATQGIRLTVGSAAREQGMMLGEPLFHGMRTTVKQEGIIIAGGTRKARSNMTRVMSGLIEVNDAAIASISGTRVKVAHLVMDRMANGWDADELHRQYPHLSLAQIHAALAYYYDHRQDVDAQIRQSVEEAERLAAGAGEPPLVRRLRAGGGLP